MDCINDAARNVEEANKDLDVREALDKYVVGTMGFLKLIHDKRITNPEEILFLLSNCAAVCNKAAKRIAEDTGCTDFLDNFMSESSMSRRHRDFEKTGKINDDDAVSLAYDTVVGPSQLSLDDIVGLDNVKTVLRQACILPIKSPEFFSDVNRKSWTSVLLFGPVGTSKSTLLTCIAAESDMFVIRIDPACLLSKWVGESNKKVKALFAEAVSKQPFLILIDEVDSLMSKRSEDTSEHGLQFRSQLLTLMDRIADFRMSIVILGTTNVPNLFDDGFIRRFEHRLLVPLPKLQQRVQLFKKFTSEYGKPLSNKECNWLSRKCESFSGDQIRKIVKCAYINQVDLNPKDVGEIKITKKHLWKILKWQQPETKISTEIMFDNFEERYSTMVSTNNSAV